MTLPKPVLRLPRRALTYGSGSNFQNLNSHLHVIFTNPPEADYYGKGSFKACPTPHPKDLENVFCYEVFKMLKSVGKINDVVIENMMNWPPAPLLGRRVEPTPRRENLARGTCPP